MCLWRLPIPGYFDSLALMLRAFCATWTGDDLPPILDREETHHLVRVRRVRRQETLEVLNGRGDVATCQVASIDGRDLRLELTGRRAVPSPVLRRHAFVALPKGKTFPSLLHRLVELGVSAVTPLLSDHSEALAERAEARTERWQTILVEALKQSGNPWLPRLAEPCTLDAALTIGSGAIHQGDDDCSLPMQRLCGALQPDAVPLQKLLRERIQARGEIQLFIGPEGDFSSREYKLLRSSGCLFASLGPLVLRVETAASLLAGALALWSDASSQS